jgi:DNA invertase Pin-like site-specific DNA recombinase
VVKQPSQRITALYERLSRDDERESESVSIENQKAILEDYANKNGFGNTAHFTDDGWSGTRWDRPGFTRMMDEIEAGTIGVILCKDLSRLGRDYLRVGLFMETLRQKSIRLIAIGDNVDTAQGEDDFMPFRNILAEWYARDISRKLKAVFKSKGMSGRRTASHPLYGYVKCAEDKNQWLADPGGAEVVRRIFRMTIEGRGPSQIAAALESEQVPCPSYYLAGKGLGNNVNKVFTEPCRWHGTTISTIIGRREYMGHMVNFKTFKQHFKDKHRRHTPDGQQVVFESKHPAIIDTETWETANRIRRNTKRRRTNFFGESNPLTGLLYCAGCGGKLYNERGFQTTGHWKDIYICSAYRKRPKDCMPHRIHTAAVRELVLDALRTVSGHAGENEDGFARRIDEIFSNQQAAAMKARRKKLTLGQKRRDELDKLIQRIYEDMAAGRITGKRFEILSGGYEREQAELERVIAELKAEADSFDDSAAQTESFLKLTRRYTDFAELTPPMLHELIRKITVHQRADKNKQRTKQKIEIHLNFTGQSAVPTVFADGE